MSNSKIVYQNWIVELGHDPSVPHEFTYAGGYEDGSRAKTRQIQVHVQQALQVLLSEEREFIEQFYLMGRSYRQISERSGRAVHKLEALHKRALRKLRVELSPFVRERFGISQNTEPIEQAHGLCPICNSPEREAIDHLIAERDPSKTWRPILKALRERFGLNIKSPQVLIGHEKYHGITSRKDNQRQIISDREMTTSILDPTDSRT